MSGLARAIPRYHRPSQGDVDKIAAMLRERGRHDLAQQVLDRRAAQR